jgi:hypothetical protein
MLAKTAAAANAIVDAIRGIIDVGTGSPHLKALASNDTVLLDITLNTTAAFGASDAGVATAAAPVSGGGAWATFSQLPAAAGTISKAGYYDANDALQYSCTVSTIAQATGELRLTSLTTDTAVPVTTTVAPTITVAVV